MLKTTEVEPVIVALGQAHAGLGAAGVTRDRPHIDCVRLESTGDGGVLFVSTNSYVLTVAELSGHGTVHLVSGEGELGSGQGGLSIPRGEAKDLLAWLKKRKRSNDGVMFDRETNGIRVTVGDDQYNVSTPDQTYPNYRQLIEAADKDIDEAVELDGRFSLGAGILDQMAKVARATGPDTPIVIEPGSTNLKPMRGRIGESCTMLIMPVRVAK